MYHSIEDVIAEEISSLIHSEIERRLQDDRVQKYIKEETQRRIESLINAEFKSIEQLIEEHRQALLDRDSLLFDRQLGGL